MTIFQRITQTFQKLISKLNNDDDDRAVFTGSEGDLTRIVESNLEVVLNEQATDNVVPMTRARSSSHAA